MSRKTDSQVTGRTPEEEKRNIDEEQTRLLQKMIERQEHDIKLARITAFAECSLLAVLVIVFAVLVPRFYKTVQTVEESMERVDILVDHAEESLSEVTDLAKDADDVIEANGEKISLAIDNFNSVDFESLNKSISEIAEVIEPVVDVVNILRE